AYILILLISVSTMSVAVYAAWYPMIVSFCTLIYLPFVVRLFVAGTRLTFIFGIMLIVYLLLVLLMAKRLNLSALESFRNRIFLKAEIRTRKEAESELKKSRDELDLRVKERTHELLTSNDQLRKMTNAFHNVSEMILILSEDGSIEYANEGAITLTGYLREELVGEKVDLLKITQAGTDEKVDLAASFGTALKSEFLLETKNGETRQIVLTKTPVLDEDNSLAADVVVAVDVTDNRVLEKALCESNKLSAVGTFVSGIVHEMCTPLNTIVGFSEEIQKKDGLSNEIDEYNSWITSESRRCLSLCENLLGFAKNDSKDWGPVDLAEVVRELMDLYKYRRGIESIEAEAIFSDREFLVKGNKEKLRQVFINILQNAHIALKGQKNGRIGVEGRQDGDNVSISIENNGSLIPEANLKRIFHPFFTTDSDSGTGLGLFIANNFANECGGEIHVENLVGGGVRFNVEFPCFDKSDDSYSDLSDRYRQMVGDVGKGTGDEKTERESLEEDRYTRRR
ncbi:MAG: PAS domain-containing sensor histidine kinase, partial [Proteobacteria bacterium]|nr:PAS domain-containing sensor histidine kinase [Pseudomonadota bacterium]